MDQPTHGGIGGLALARQIKDSWLKEYLRYTDMQESPDIFHLWVGLSVIATILNREVCFNLKAYKVWPNQFIILVAGSQQCRKSTAIQMGQDILESIPKEFRPQVLAQKITPEALIETLKETKVAVGEHGIKPLASGLLVASELSVLIDKQARNSGLLAVLVDLYDSKDRWEYKTRLHGKEELLNVYLNLLAGSSPEYLRISLPYDEIGGGMLARTIFVYAAQPKRRIPFPMFGAEQQKQQDRLVHDLMEISKLRGEVEISPDGRRWYSEWYMNVKHNIAHPALKSYYAKKENHVLKIAQLLSVAESDSLVVDEVHLQMALSILDRNEKGLPHVLGELVSSQTGYKTQVVLNVITDLCSNDRRVTRTNLISRLHHVMDIEEIDRAIETLVAANMIDKVLAAGKGGFSFGLPKANDG